MKTFVIIVFLLLIIGAVAVHYGYWQFPQLTALPAEPASECGLTVAQPLPDTAVSYQIEVNGTIDTPPNATGCTWSMFEGQGGQAKVVDANGDILAGPVPISVSDWTATSTPFTVELDMLAASSTLSLAEGTPLTIELTPENPSGQVQSTMLSIPVVLRK